MTLLFKATRRVLTPLLRALVRMGVTLPGLLPHIKEAYVEAAKQVLKDQGRKQTISQLHILTGVHRRDLKDILSDSGEEKIEKLPLVAAVISEWRNNPLFRDDQGAPLPLLRESEDASQLSFARLVRSINKDVHFAAVLSELEARQMITLDPATARISLRSQDEIQSQSQNNGFQALSFIVGGHLETAVSNVFEEQPKLLHRAILYDSMSQRSVKTLQELAEQRSKEVLDELNARANALAIEDRGQDDKSGTILYGAFLHLDTKTPDEPSA